MSIFDECDLSTNAIDLHREFVVMRCIHTPLMTRITQYRQMYFDDIPLSRFLIEPEWRNGRASNSGARDHVFEPQSRQLYFPLAKGILIGTARGRGSSLGMHIGLSTHHCSPLSLCLRGRPSPLNCKNESMVITLEEETAAQTVVGSIVWALRKLRKPRCREMSARSYALHSVNPNFLQSLLRTL